MDLSGGGGGGAPPLPSMDEEGANVPPLAGGAGGNGDVGGNGRDGVGGGLMNDDGDIGALPAEPAMAGKRPLEEEEDEAARLRAQIAQIEQIALANPGLAAALAPATAQAQAQLAALEARGGRAGAELAAGEIEEKELAATEKNKPKKPRTTDVPTPPPPPPPLPARPPPPPLPALPPPPAALSKAAAACEKFRRAASAEAQLPGPRGVYGLPNLGATCCLAAPVQVLAAVPSIVDSAERIFGDARPAAELNKFDLEARCIASGIVAVAKKKMATRKLGALCLNEAHSLLFPSERGAQDDATFFLDLCLVRLSLPVPELVKTSKCLECSEEAIAIGNLANTFTHTSIREIKTVETHSVLGGLRDERTVIDDFKCASEACRERVTSRRVSKLSLPDSDLFIVAITRFEGGGKPVSRARVKFERVMDGSDVDPDHPDHIPTRRLVGLLSHTGDDFGRTGHYVATARRFVACARPKTQADDAELEDVAANVLLRFNDSQLPSPRTWQQIIDEEAHGPWKTTILLYEAVPSGAPYREAPIPEPSSLELPHAPAPRRDAPKICREKVLFRDSDSADDEQREASREIVAKILRAIIDEDGQEGLFGVDPEYLLCGSRRGGSAGAGAGAGAGTGASSGAGESSVLHGQCQSGKTKTTLLLAWIAHFVYDTVPVIFVRSSGGAESIRQFCAAIMDFNARIKRLLLSTVRGYPAAAVKSFFLVPCAKNGESEANHLADLDGANFNEGRAQVLFRLLNKTNIQDYFVVGRAGGNRPRSGDVLSASTWYRALHETGKLWHGQPTADGHERFTLFFDEGDLTVTTGDRIENMIEKALFLPGHFPQLDAQPDDDGSEHLDELNMKMAVTERSVIGAMWHSVFITATPATIYFTAERGERVRVSKLPIPSNYFGISKRVPSERRINQENGLVVFTKEDVATGPAAPDKQLERHPGVLEMAKGVHEGARAHPEIPRVCLVNAESRLAGQHGISDELIEYFASEQPDQPVLIVSHNGGNAASVTADGFKYGCKLRALGVGADVMAKFSPADPDAEIEANDVITPDLLAKMSKGAVPIWGVGEQDGVPFVAFRRGSDIRSILSLMKNVAALVLKDKGVQPLIFIVTGSMGGRGISYKDHGHVMHLTDEYIYLSDKTSRQHTSIQLASRLCGIYTDRPKLRLWCSETTWENIRDMIDLEDDFTELAREAFLADKPVRRTIDKEASFAPYRHIAQQYVKSLRLFSARVGRNWAASSSSILEDSTVIVKQTEDSWTLQLNTFLAAGEASSEGSATAAATMADSAAGAGERREAKEDMDEFAVRFGGRARGRRPDACRASLPLRTEGCQRQGGQDLGDSAPAQPRHNRRDAFRARRRRTRRDLAPLLNERLGQGRRGAAGGGSRAR